MLFSILIANYNNEAFFEDCFNSIMAQTYQDFEVVIVDDASTDNSFDVIAKMVANDKRFRVFSNEKNEGCGFTKRRCAQLATGDICAYLDPDDTITDNALEVMANAHKENPEACIVSAKYTLTDLNLNITGYGTHGQQIPEGESYLTFGNGAITAFASFKKACYDQSSGIDTKFKRAVDQDLYLKLEEFGPQIFVDQFLYFYRINDNSISANKNLFKAEYWHFLAKKDAYYRRKNRKTLAKNLTPKQFKALQNNYYISRFQREAKESHIAKKYYFLFKSFGFFADWKYKILCLIKPKYY
ncbi:MAG TPA: glycosyltransferase family 2 protein [Flavobacterium sp.]|nr:glycosyltransferase family 2 protein [Flavobacterium sp.]